MTAFKKHSVALPYLYIILGTALMGIATQCIYDAAGLVTGGFTGIAIVVKQLTAPLLAGGIPLWFTNLVLNVPVFIVAYLQLGKKFIGRTLFGTVMLSAWLYILPDIDIPQGDYLLAALFGGIFSGAGMGLVLRGNATTGGTDMVSALIQRYARHYSVVQIMQFVDGVVVVLGFFVFGLRPTLYAAVAIFVATKVGDTVLEGLNYSKAAFIITDRYEQVAQILMRDLDRGATGLMARGMYTGDQKCVLYCVVSRKQIVALKEVVAEIDPNAFVIVSDVHEVLGEGFQENTIPER
jgi:uncharacterized membrane-anchored protein YitT (DUF2179 family)